MFKIGSLLLNFLKLTEADELIAPARVGTSESGLRFVLTINASDVDTTCAVLKDQGVELLTAPVDRPWGIRTANFTDLDGYIWEIASPIHR